MADDFWTPQMVAGLTGFGGVVIGAMITWFSQDKRIDADERLARKKFEFDKDLAQRKFDQERAQVIHKRRFELAETLLADAYRFRDLMRYVRSGFSSEGEGETRKGNHEESDSLKRLKNSYFSPVERLQKHNDFVAGFMVKRHTALAYFGPEAAKAFQLLNEAIADVQTASEGLIEIAGESGNHAQEIKRLKADLWIGHSRVRKEADQVNKKIEEGVALIEKVSKPVLEWDGS